MKKFKRFLKRQWLNVWEPPSLTNNKKTLLKKKLAAEWRELKLLDLAILSFMLASMYQLAVFFAKGEPTFWTWLKAGAFDLAIFIFSKGVSRAMILKEKAKSSWAALVLLSVITMYANIGFEWYNETKGFGDDHILKDIMLNIRAVFISGSLPLIVVFLSPVRALTEKSFNKRWEEYNDIIKNAPEEKKNEKEPIKQANGQTYDIKNAVANTTRTEVKPMDEKNLYTFDDN